MMMQKMLPAKIIDITDEGLIKSISNDDQGAYKALFSRYWKKLYIYAYNILRDKDVCEDIVQEVFYDLWTRRNNLNIENTSAYLYGAVKLQIFKQFRKNKFRNVHSDQFYEFLSESGIAESIEYNELHNKVERLINELPEQRKLIFLMSRNDERSNKEIALELNLSVQTVKNQISAALKFIRKSLGLILFFLLK